MLPKILSAGKAATVAKRHKNTIIIATDTVVVLNGEVIGKLHTVEKAKSTLQKLSGKTHKIITGVTIIDTGTNKKVSFSTKTKVVFKTLTQGEIDNYVATEKPLVKAGAYALRHNAFSQNSREQSNHTRVFFLHLPI